MKILHRGVWTSYGEVQCCLNLWFCQIINDFESENLIAPGDFYFYFFNWQEQQNMNNTKKRSAELPGALKEWKSAITMWCSAATHQNSTNTSKYTHTTPTQIYGLYSIRLKKKKKSVSQSCCPYLFFCAHLILQNSDFHFFFLKLFFSFIFTTKNEESLLFWKNLSTWELKKRVISCLISENTEVETFQSFLVSDVRGGKGQLK